MMPCFSRFAPLAVLFVLAGSGLACDPMWRVHGQVTNPADASPISDATVTVECPDREPEQAQTDGEGNFVVTGLYSLGQECVVSVEKPGFQSERVPVREACTKVHRSGECMVAKITTALGPDVEVSTDS